MIRVTLPCIVAGLANVAIGIRFHAPFNLVLGVICLCLGGGTWWNRRGRKAVRALGAKSRALLARLALDPVT